MAIPGLSHSTSLLLYTLIAVVGLVILIGRFKLNAFVALILASLFVGVCSGLELPRIGQAFAEGLGSMLGNIAAVVGLGTILGKLLAESGGAEVLARGLTRALGEKRMPWTMMLVALVVGIPVWFTVGLVLLVPILFTAARHTGLPLLRLGIPLLAGLSIAHGLVPPHPGPMAAIGMFKADTGKTIFYSLLIGFPTAIIAGPLFGHYISRFVSVPLGAVAASLTPSRPGKGLPGFGLTLFTILLPVLMILAATVADLTLAHQDALRSVLDFLGHPTVAMLVAVLFAYYSFGHARGFNRQELARFSESCLGPVATVLLVVGAGGGFNKVLVYSGVGDAIAALAKGLHLSPLLFGWLVAALIRVATGSATVAISTAAGIVAPLALSVPGTNLELLVIAMGAGSLILSHLNDGGFWFVKEYLGLDVTQTLKTWTVMETINAVLALIFTLLLDLLI